MFNNLLKKGIFALSALIVLIIACLFWFGNFSTAWFREDRTSYMSASHIYSITQGEANNIASFKNEGQFDADLQFEVINGEFTERFIPGDVLYYTFIVTDIDISSTQSFMMELSGMIAQAEGVGADSISFVSNCRIEADTLILAVLEEFGNEEDGYYYELYPYDVNGNAFYDSTNGLSNTAVDYIYTEPNGLEVELQFTLPTGIAYPPVTNGIADLLVIVPIWYMDTGANQNIEMDCSLTIAGCIMYPYTGGGQ
jgi:hypothetical protein